MGVEGKFWQLTILVRANGWSTAVFDLLPSKELGPYQRCRWRRGSMMTRWRIRRARGWNAFIQSVTYTRRGKYMHLNTYLGQCPRQPFILEWEERLAHKLRRRMNLIGHHMICVKPVSYPYRCRGIPLVARLNHDGVVSRGALWVLNNATDMIYVGEVKMKIAVNQIIPWN